jgi:hypothetical protein
MRRWGSLLTLLLAALVFAGVGFADDDNGDGDKDKDKGKGKHARIVFNTVVTDNGSCGGPWATDTIRRTFKIQDRGNGKFRVKEEVRGSFLTLAGQSPGACETGSKHGATVLAGHSGRVKGKLEGTVTGGTLNRNATCASTCTTGQSIAAIFGSTATFSCLSAASRDCKFDFKYHAAKNVVNQSLIFREWRDRGKGAGTMLHEEFRGDIADH